MEKQEAASLLGVGSEELDLFFIEDPFNPPNTIKGFLCQRSDHRYGALVLFEINGEEISPSVIYGTPKQKYPFKVKRGQKTYHWPRTFKSVRIYEKFDGTNVLAYSYADSKGQKYVTFKTRLTPIIRDGSQACHRTLWEGLLKEDKNLQKASKTALEGLAVAFEMYGYQNPLLISYEVPITARVIFGIDQKSAGLVIPEDLVKKGVPKEAVVEISGFLEDLSHQSLITFFEDSQKGTDSVNKKIKDQIKGTEGYVFYLQEEDGWHQYKCKAPSVEPIHRLNSGRLSEAVIYPTAINALESVSGQLSVEYVKTLLKEEFDSKIIEASLGLVQTVVDQINKTYSLKKKIDSLFRSSGLSFEKDGKGKIMKHLSAQLEKEDIKRAFAILQDLGHIPS